MKSDKRPFLEACFSVVGDLETNSVQTGLGMQDDAIRWKQVAVSISSSRAIK